MKIPHRLTAAAMLCLLASSCSTLDRVGATEKRAAAAEAQAAEHKRALDSGQVVRDLTSQWINPVPINGVAGQRPALPPCTVKINRPGTVTLAYVSAFITDQCRIPVVVTPDAQAAMAGGGDAGGRTEKMPGTLPPPDASGMVPLAAMGQTTGRPVAVPQGEGGLRGVSWNGSLSGLLDNVTTRLGLSWRYEYGHIAIFWLDTRNFAINFMDSDASFVSKTVSGTTTTTGTSGGSGGGSTGDNSTTQTTTATIKSNIFKDVENTVKSMLTPGSGRLNLSAGVLTVTDTPRVLDAIGRYIDDRNRELNRQVMISVKVFSVENRHQNQLGIDWNAVLNTGSVGLSLTSPFTGAASDALSGGVAILDGKGEGTQTFLKALDEQAKLSVVTSASALTTNLSAVPVQNAIQQDYVPNISTSQTANVGTSTSITTATITTGFNMTALPLLFPDSPKMQLEFSISMSDDPTFKDFTSGGQNAQLAKTTPKTIVQRVIMQSGQTLVLSGYEQLSDSANRQGTGSYNFFGLGGGARGDDSRRMFIILVTPVVLG
ncbi:PilN family type IVB pilus formation outer membrane protein [Candidatus Pantoea floridensis]|uniref:Type IVB pilus formation outer membrane protein, R64 PilN family n=1 Tax=Candidatus Pantoea floridensis TaxID=1938870 RepID=A0A286DRZ6_9GAMM|nr:PilN family type IVB pilus formation outer membrane protein [Pantoea floridensis]PIF06892.1 type IVB pilus formation R64 PilN family outer membrane protein [Enterobacteriaceae bacterium JKS000233]SOD61421.1 type IVB pilus formation outer membrane protein, R64 PilN family [Pantoea floridensis]